MQYPKKGLNAIFRPRFDYRAYSRPGIFSFIVALLVAFILIGDVGMVLRFQNDPATLQRFTILDPILTWSMAFLACAGIILGIASMAQKQKRRLFGLVGLVANGLFLLGIVGLYLANIVGFWRLAPIG